MTLRVIVGLCIVGLIGFGCSGQTSDAQETAAQAQGTATEVSPANEVAQSGDSESVSAAAYAEVIRQANDIQRSTPKAQMLEAVNKIVSLFEDFAKRYPDSEEALDARLQLGMIYTSLNRAPEAITYLEQVVSSGDRFNDKVGYAHYYLAEAYKAADQFDKAKRHYSIVIDEYQKLGPQVSSMAKASLEDMDILRRLAVGSEPIPFNVVGTEGEKLSLDKYKGKVVLLDFWATWCGPCRVEMPNVVKLHKKFNKAGFEIIGISLDRSREALDRYVEANGMAWPQFFDGKYWQNEVATKYKVRSIPATYLIDRQGKIRYRTLRGKQLEEAVDKLVNETS